MKSCTLSNNMKMVVYPINIQELVSIGMFFRVGSQNEIESTNGITHLFEHIISDRFINDCASIGGRANALTTKEYCCFFAKCLSTKFEDIIRCFRRICNFYFDEANIIKAKNTVINEMKGIDIEQSLDQEIFEEHLRGESLRFLPMGMLENISHFTIEDIYTHYEQYFQPMNCVLSIAGSVDMDNCILIAEKMFNDWLGNKKVLIEQHHTLLQINKSTISSKLLLSKTSSIRMVFDGVSQNSVNKMANLLLCNYLGGGTHSKLFQFVRQKSIAYNAFCVPQYFFNRGIVYFKIVGISEDVNDVIKHISNFMLLLRNKKIPLKDVQIIKSSMVEDYIFKHETLSSKMTLMGQQLLMDNFVTTDKMIIDSINNVSSIEIEEALKKLFLGDITIMLSDSRETENHYFNRTFI